MPCMASLKIQNRKWRKKEDRKKGKEECKIGEYKLENGNTDD